MSREEELTVARRMAGARLLLTGATGFLGKAVLASWLRAVPAAGEATVLIRAPDDGGAERRLQEHVLASEAFAGAETTGRVRALAADLSRDDLGGLDPAALADVDVVIHCAASVSFEQPLDEMLELNALGIGRLLDALARAGAHDAQLIHVSTAYAAGLRTGLVLELPYGTATTELDVDLHAELDAARAWRRDLAVTSRLPSHQKRFVAEARQELGPAGALSVGTRAEALRHTWVAGELTERGRARSRALGWAEAYTLSKALAEREVLRRGVPRLTFVRPSIIESALATPFPGWLEGIKVADPVILAYGRGLVPRFPGELSVRLDLVPVDLVANACVVAAALAPEVGLPRTVHIASGARNPLRISAITEHITAYFRAHPLPDDEGVPVEVPEWRFDSSSEIHRALDRADRALTAGRRLMERTPLPRADALEHRLHRARRRAERLRRLAEIYGPYVELDCVFDDRQAQALAEGLTPEDRAALPFDPALVDWGRYLGEAHLPALRRLVAPPRPARAIARPTAPSAPAEGPPALAFFDVEGVVLDTTVVHAYAWLRGRMLPAPDRALWLARLATRAPAWSVLDRGSRAAFSRAFYEQYRGLPAAELRAQATEALSELLLPRVQHAAIRRVRAHRQRGDRVVLLTGALDFLVAPLAHLGDELIAARLVEHEGRFTGELTEPPLTADGRAATAAALAAARGVSLVDCHAYGDSISDLALLEAVGHPHAVNPDFRLAREARRRHWPVLEWTAERAA